MGTVIRPLFPAFLGRRRSWLLIFSDFADFLYAISQFDPVAELGYSG